MPDGKATPVCTERVQMFAVDLDDVRSIKTTPRDSSDVGPALEGQAESRAAVWAEVNVDLPAAGIGCVLVGSDFPVVELDGVSRKDRLCEERSSGKSLAERAVARQRSQGQLVGAESDSGAEAATFKNS
jgi:hypothetical protein